MNKKIITKVFLFLLTAANTCQAGGCAQTLAREPQQKQACSIDAILKQLSQKTRELESYQCRIEYLLSQPLFESQSLRTGRLYYQSSGKASALRINFQTLKQDDEKEQKYVEHYIFDGVWLTHIDHQIKQVKKYQLTEPNQPADAFELAGRNFPIIGFTKADELKKEFEIKLIMLEETEAAKFFRLHLKVKPDSVYKDDYTSVEFWIDKETSLPAKIVAVSTEDDIYQIRLLDAEVHKTIDKKLLEIEVPEGFGKPGIIPLKKNGK